MTDAETDILARLQAIEIRAAHQDRVIDELNGVITDQWREIDKLKRRLAQFDDQLAEFEHLAGEGRKEPPPPHY